MSKRRIWMIGICSSEINGVVLNRVFGTKAEVKRHLVRLVKEDRKRDQNAWEHGVVAFRDVEEDPITGVLYAYANYSYYHIDYSAKPEGAPEPLDPLGRKQFKKTDAEQFNDYMQKWQIRDHNGVIYQTSET